jgi:mRNA interferase RelE/StbE
MKTIVYSSAAAKQLDELSEAARVQIENGLDTYATVGAGDVKKLKAQNGYRLRIGRYRVIFDEDATTVLAVFIGKRDSQTYRHH